MINTASRVRITVIINNRVCVCLYVCLCERERKRQIILFVRNTTRWGEQRRYFIAFAGIIDEGRARPRPLLQRTFSHSDPSCTVRRFLLTFLTFQGGHFVARFQPRGGCFRRRNNSLGRGVVPRDRGIMQFVLLARTGGWVYEPPLLSLDCQSRARRRISIRCRQIRRTARRLDGTPTNAMNMVISIIYPVR